MGAQPTLSPSLSPLSALPLPSGTPPPTTLPPQPSLAHLKHQAKSLLVAAGGGDSAALERLARYFPALRPSPLGVTAPAATAPTTPTTPTRPQPTLAQAQLVIAREYGFASWRRLRQAVELAPLRALLQQMAARPIDWAARRHAAEALAAAPKGLQVALEALSDPDPELRGAALGFIDHHATDACVPQLSQVAHTDPDPKVRRLAVHALTCERCKPTPLALDPLPVLLDAFRTDPSRRVRHGAIPMRYHDQPEVQAAFREAALEDPSGLVRRGAVYGLKTDDSLPLLAQVAQTDPDPHVRVAAAQKLGREPYRQLACRVLAAALRECDKPQVRRDAHLALKRLSPDYRQRVAQLAREASLARKAQHAEPVEQAPERLDGPRGSYTNLACPKLRDLR